MIDKHLKQFLYRYERNGTLDVSQFDMTYKEANEKIKRLTYHDKTFEFFVIQINEGRSTTPDMSEKAESIKMILPDVYEKQYELLPAVNQKIDEIVKSMHPEWSDFEKALYVHDWICLNSKYDVHGPSAHHLSGTLLDGRAVCQSFTYTFNTILHRIGIPVAQVDGNSHTFSEVCLDGEWYIVDITPENVFGLGVANHSFSFISKDRYFKLTNRTMADYKPSYADSMDNSMAVHTRYEKIGEHIGLFQENGWRQENSPFQYYEGHWYNGDLKGGKYDPRTKKYITSKDSMKNEIWVYRFNPETKAFESVGTGLPKGDWKENYQGLFIVDDIALTRTEDEFVTINLKTGKAAPLMKVEGTIKEYYTDYTGIIRYRLDGDSTVYTHKI